MALINYDQLEDGFDATANIWNERFAKIHKEINGNLDAANFKNLSVTREKIANGAIDASKLDISKSVDANGWTVVDMGGIKTYSRTITCPPLNLGEGIRGTAATIDPPVGRTRDNITVVTAWYGQYSGHVILGCEANGASKITVQVAHNWPTPLVMSGKIHLLAQEQV